jgi:hypothetical protein
MDGSILNWKIAATIHNSPGIKIDLLVMEGKSKQFAIAQVGPNGSVYIPLDRLALIALLRAGLEQLEVDTSSIKMPNGGMVQ